MAEDLVYELQQLESKLTKFKPPDLVGDLEDEALDQAIYVVGLNKGKLDDLARQAEEEKRARYESRVAVYEKDLAAVRAAQDRRLAQLKHAHTKEIKLMKTDDKSNSVVLNKRFSDLDKTFKSLHKLGMDEITYRRDKNEEYLGRPSKYAKLHKAQKRLSQKEPQIVSIKVEALGGLKDRSAHGQYCLVISKLEHVGGPVEPWLWSYEDRKKPKKRNFLPSVWGFGVRKPVSSFQITGAEQSELFCSATKPFTHGGTFEDVLTEIDSPDLHTSVPPVGLASPTSVFLFELVLLRGPAAAVDTTIGWGLIPQFDVSLHPLSGKFSIPMLKGAPDSDITLFQNYRERLSTIKHDWWLCNAYVTFAVAEIATDPEIAAVLDAFVARDKKVIHHDRRLSKIDYFSPRILANDLKDPTIRQDYNSSLPQPKETSGQLSAANKVRVLKRVMAADLNFDNLFSWQFFVTLLMFALWLPARMYVRTFSQLFILQYFDIPMYSLDFKYVWGKVYYEILVTDASVQILTVAAPLIAFIVLMLFLSIMAYTFQTMFGKALPLAIGNFITVTGMYTILDPFIQFITDAIFSNHKYYEVLYLYNWFDFRENSGVFGILMTTLIYFLYIILAVMCLYYYLLFIHTGGRTGDTFQRMTDTFGFYYSPDDHEITLRELRDVCRRAIRFRGHDFETKLHIAKEISVEKKDLVDDDVDPDTATDAFLYTLITGVDYSVPPGQVDTMVIRIDDVHFRKQKTSKETKNIEVRRIPYRRFLRLPEGNIIEAIDSTDLSRWIKTGVDESAKAVTKGRVLDGLIAGVPDLHDMIAPFDTQL
ncbi:hypothetical protein PCE1_000811 [Barthelona sp. PCE]